MHVSLRTCPVLLASAAAAALPPLADRSIIKSGRPLTEAGTPVLGHAQRAPAGEAPPHTITKELQALMSDLRLGDPAELEQVGGCGWRALCGELLMVPGLRQTRDGTAKHAVVRSAHRGHCWMAVTHQSTLAAPSPPHPRWALCPRSARCAPRGRCAASWAASPAPSPPYAAPHAKRRPAGRWRPCWRRQGSATVGVDWVGGAWGNGSSLAECCSGLSHHCCCQASCCQLCCRC